MTIRTPTEQRSTRSPDQQDKRSVVVVEHADLDRWLAGDKPQATDLLKLAPVEAFDHGPAAEAMGSLF